MAGCTKIPVALTALAAVAAPSVAPAAAKSKRAKTNLSIKTKAPDSGKLSFSHATQSGPFDSLGLQF